MNPQDEKKTVIRSNGKLMISGEYLVLSGAESLTLPLKKGQKMSIARTGGIPSLSWKTTINGCFWFEARFSIPDFAIANTNDFPTAQYVRELLLAARKLNPGFLTGTVAYVVENELEFNVNWGFGSSSSLMYNLAVWAGVSPYELHFLVSDGSGYDIAAAGSDFPVIYSVHDHHPHVSRAGFSPAFRDKLFFVYTGRKVDSSREVSRFNGLQNTGADAVGQITDITRKMAVSKDFSQFTGFLEDHEAIISGVIGKKPVGKTEFKDFKGVVKSLGAWGGDFLLMATDLPVEYMVTYLRKKDLKTWFRYDDIVLWHDKGSELNESNRYGT
ncbi:MAG TPA: GYDIA family GHMP kinase [Bacteroidales bacterium]|nr:GYDIA family GHMP kinase [Bacteroidales bacterium]